MNKIDSCSRIEIVFTINQLRKTGPNQVLNNMVSGIDASKYHVTVVSLMRGSDENEIADITKMGATVVSLDISNKRGILSKGPALLRGVLQEIKPTIIHSHGILSDIASYRSGYDAKYISTVHNNIFEDYSFTFGQLRGRLFAWWHIIYLKRFDKVVCCSSSAYDVIKKYLPNATFVRNGIRSFEKKSMQFDIRRKLGIKKTDLVYIYIGKLSARKNVIALLKNFSTSSATDEHLIILGEGDLKEECENYSNTNIHLLGFQSDTNAFLNVSDIYVSASKSEGFSISVIEALEKGLYVLLSQIPSHTELLNIDKRIYIGETFDDNNFSLKKDNLAGRRLSKDIPIHFKERYLSDRAMMKAYEDIYGELI